MLWNYLFLERLRKEQRCLKVKYESYEQIIAESMHLLIENSLLNFSSLCVWHNYITKEHYVWEISVKTVFTCKFL